LCCGVSQCLAVRCSVLQGGTVWYSALQSVPACSSALQCGAVSVLQCFGDLKFSCSSPIFVKVGKRVHLVRDSLSST